MQERLAQQLPKEGSEARGESPGRLSSPSQLSPHSPRTESPVDEAAEEEIDVGGDEEVWSCCVNVY